jgi:glycosyltransferase involved in cell wall biosynthesis
MADPIRVAYTTWKSELGDDIANEMRDEGFQFSSIGGSAAWDEIRSLYGWADVFLGTPNEEEGFYLPGLEAMCGGAVVVIPDVVGNRAYCRFGENCVGVEYEDIESYKRALRHIKGAEWDEMERLRANGWEEVQKWSLEREREEFGSFLEELGANCRQVSYDF